MPTIYLSPSVQDYNQYVTGTGNEEYYMNLIADAMAPYLRASGIAFTRNNPYDTLDRIVEQSNAGDYDFHLALHSNTAPESLAGTIQGPDVYYYAGSVPGLRAADIFADNLRTVYPNPNLVATIPNTSLAELRRVKAPANLIELAYHDNYDDAAWIAENIEPIAKNLVLSLTEYLGISFKAPRQDSK
ncbi:N-acetylmuramoyl-L-alanine amidase [Anaerovorax odorimutans]|uniref:N-acetylmuramoyl-L-alanine amidase n=1 Tax=Anaerovorax odorimutans TaxID=109327 RepID=A0ABT1RTP0_9FIRM|nr:N-acetylmuramoyl-L-alanine amidase [Anaerovorax odorimutans]MCQ4638547.1 N-acetylmuramoyl-L-alanine amidase [Anaerovorax odorimutans]